MLDRRTGAQLCRSSAFVPQSERVFRRPTAGGIVIAPGAAGGANWPPGPFHPGTGLVYVPATHSPTRYRAERDASGRAVGVLSFPDYVPRGGTLSAIDPASGRIA